MSRRVIPAMLLAALLMGTLTWMFSIQSAKAESGVIYIRADGSIDPSDAPILTVDNITYTFTSSFNSSSFYSIVTIERDNITLDGAGYTLQGPGKFAGTGISLDGRSNVTVENFKIDAFLVGIDLHNSSNNVIRGNRLGLSPTQVSLGIGIWLGGSCSNNAIARNRIGPINYKGGIYFSGASNNSVYENAFVTNATGIWIDFSDCNAFYHNDFMNNSLNAYYHVPGLLNTWDNGYPSGGNYWGPTRSGYNDYTGVDNWSGPYQNETGSDGIGDTPYSFGIETDHYPLMNPYGGYSDIGATVTPSKSTIGEGYNTTVSTNVTIINYGVQAETFNFTFQTPTAVYQEEGLTLASRDSISLTFEWNTTGFSRGNYTIAAYLTPVEGEIFTSDNNQTIQITITIAGDVTSPTGPPDGKVDMRDIGAICSKFSTMPSSPNLNPNMDVNDDGVVNMRDIGIACGNFGKT